MGVSNWMVEGIGLNANKLIPFLNKERCIARINEMFDEDIVNDKENFDIKDYMYGKPFNNIAELFWRCDSSDILTYGNNGDAEYYLYYPPSYPWDRRENEPQNIEEVHNLIISAVQSICDITKEQLEELINDDLYEYGCG